MSQKINIKIIAVVFMVFLVIILAVTIPYFYAPYEFIKFVGRHVDPNAEPSRLPLSNFFTLLVLNPFSTILRGNFSGVSEDLKVLELAYVPSGLRFIIERFKRLINDVANHLYRAVNLMDEAEALIDAGRASDARFLLNEASIEIAQANATCRELKLASEEMARSFGLPIDKIRLRLIELNQLIEELRLRLLNLFDRIEHQANLIETLLLINVEPKTVWTGGRITVEGTLLARGNPLSERSVIILVDGRRIAENLTSRDGSFRADIKLPYIYKPEISVRAKYEPKGVDAEIYSPTISDAIDVSLLYIEPRIFIEPIEKVLPGKTFTLRGRVQSTSPPPYFNVKVLWIGMDREVNLLEDGRFETMLYVPGDVLDGAYQLKVSVPAMGVFAPASASISVIVERLPIDLTLNVPGLMIAGFSHHLTGSFRSKSEQLSANVKVYFAGREYAASSDGDFTVQLNLPITLLSGHYVCRVRVTPVNAWYKEYAYDASILVINPLTVLTPTTALIYLAIKVFSRRASTATKSVFVEETEERLMETHEGETYLVADRFRQIMDAYWEAVKVVSDATGVDMKPYMTMREYLAVTAPKLGSSSQYFEMLTLAAERALYSPEVPAWITLTAKMVLKILSDECARVKSKP